MAVDSRFPAAVQPLAATAAARVRLTPTDPEYWANIRYLTFGRAVPAALFGFMGWVQLRRVLDALPSATRADALVHLVPQLLYALFCAIPVVIYLTRPKPHRRDGSLGARAAAFTGTLMQLVVGAFLPSGPRLWIPPEWTGAAVLVLGAGAWAFALWGIVHLRRSLSIIPEARRLVTTGPYRLVRHPLYVAEIVAAVSVVLSWPALVPTAALSVFIVMQLIRMRFEERLLSAAFPDEYPAYRDRTARVVPNLI
ncbi:MAG TPA: isoprenylcysteine carboxylmethyltransferase family protein [Candidatus Dormibacteraeota bacterium]|nr:isoprenylcysteine carboxylmethyltransferase family protein [Candidatus Dormibacteraeota bacterium]